MRTVIDLATTSTLFCEDDDTEMVRIDFVDLEEGTLHGTGEESDEEFIWNLNEIDLSTASWWKIVPNV